MIVFILHDTACTIYVHHPYYEKLFESIRTKQWYYYLARIRVFLRFPTNNVFFCIVLYLTVKRKRWRLFTVSVWISISSPIALSKNTQRIQFTKKSTNLAKIKIGMGHLSRIRKCSTGGGQVEMGPSFLIYPVSGAHDVNLDTMSITPESTFDPKTSVSHHTVVVMLSRA